MLVTLRGDVLMTSSRVHLRLLITRLQLLLYWMVIGKELRVFDCRTKIIPSSFI